MPWNAPLRSRLRDALWTLTDREYQKRAWVRHDLPGIEDSLDEVYHFFFDDTVLATNPNEALGTYLEDAEEQTAVSRVVIELEGILSELGHGAHDAAFLENARWNRVVRAASDALNMIDTHDSERRSD